MLCILCLFPPDEKTILLIYLPREKTFVFSSRNTLIDNQFIVSAIASITEQKLISLTMSSLKLSCKTTMKRVFLTSRITKETRKLCGVKAELFTIYFIYTRIQKETESEHFSNRNRDTCETKTKGCIKIQSKREKNVKQSDFLRLGKRRKPKKAILLITIQMIPNSCCNNRWLFNVLLYEFERKSTV